jgi:Concanavalin A-like lectin/glucanases superfamily
MFDTALVFAPLVVLAIVALLGFVGCDLDFDSLGGAPPPIPYQDLIVGTPGLIRYWPLGDPPGSVYVSFIEPTQVGAQAEYFPDNPEPASIQSSGPSGFPSTKSAASSGDLTLGAGLLLGTDTSTSMHVDGGYVMFQPEPALNPPASPGFTIEAWVYPEWDADEDEVERAVVSSLDSNNAHGFVLLKNAENRWAVRIGTGDSPGPFAQSNDLITPHLTYHLLAAYDGNTNTLALYVDGSLAGSNTPANPYVPNDSESNDPEFYIGAARLAGNVPAAALFPFKGRIQAVAIYNRPLIWPDEVQARWWAANYLG